MTDGPDRVEVSVGPHLDADEILDLLHGFVGKSTEDAWLGHLMNCVGCEESFRENLLDRERHRASCELVRRADGSLVLERRTAVAAVASGEPDSIGWFTRLKQIPRPLWMSGCFATAAVLFLLILRPSDQVLWSDGLPILPVSAVIHVRGTEVGTDEAFSRGLTLYDSGQFGEAVGEFEQGTPSGTREIVRILFLASAHALQGNAPETILLLEDTDLTLVPDPWAVESYWTLEAALREVGRDSKADSLLQRIAEREDAWGQRAQERLATTPANH